MKTWLIGGLIFIVIILISVFFGIKYTNEYNEEQRFCVEYIEKNVYVPCIDNEEFVLNNMTHNFFRPQNGELIKFNKTFNNCEELAIYYHNQGRMRSDNTIKEKNFFYETFGKLNINNKCELIEEFEENLQNN